MMRDELTMAELNREFYGQPPKVEAKFYDKEVTDTSASRDAGHRVMKTATYIHLVCHREGAEIHRPMQDLDKRNFAQAWQAYQQEKKDAESDAGHRAVPDLRPLEAGGTG